MQISGRRIHFAGSANPETEESRIRYGHDLIDRLVSTLAARGATFLTGIGREPHARPGAPASPPIVFDWTALAAADTSRQQGAAQAVGPGGPLVITMATAKTEEQIPDNRQNLWEELISSGAMELHYVESGWTSGAVRRFHQARLGDILVALGGGEGVEHLAQLYAEAGKPMILLDLALGASTDEGSGGAARLAGKALAHPEQFARFRDPSTAATLLRGISTRQGQRPVEEVVAGVVALMEALIPPTAFYVRLLNPEIEGFSAVEGFFSDVVDPVVREFGYEPVVADRGVNEYAWMNDAIFDSLHHSAIVIADLTGLRANCFMELGYALGSAQRVLVTAKAGTRLPFDAQMIEFHAWLDTTPIERRREAWREHWRRNINRPPMVKLRGVL